MPKPKVKRMGNKATARGSVKKSGSPKKSLADYQSAWESAETVDLGKFGVLPDGKYQGYIEEALIDGGQVKWTVTITAPEEFAGRKAFLNNGLEVEAVPYLKGALQMLELPIPEKLEDLPEILHDAKNIGVEVNVRSKFSEKHQRDFSNTYFTARLDTTEDGGEEVEPAEEAAGEGDDGVALEVGIMVSFESEGKTLVGKVTAINEDTASVDVEGEEWDVEFDELTIEEPVEPKASPKKVVKKTVKADEVDYVGKTVEFEFEDSKQQGQVLRLTKDGDLEVDINGEEWVIDPAEVTVVQPSASPKKVVKKVAKKF